MAVNMKKYLKSRAEKQKLFDNKEWYTIRSLLGNQWARYFVLIGARERGKSYSVQDYCLRQRYTKGIPFYWMRLNDISINKMKQNNGAKIFEPLLIPKYKLTNIKVKGDFVYDSNGEVVCQLLSLSTSFNDKGSAIFDASTFNGCNIILDEFQFERKQKRTFDVIYNLKMQIENICRSHSNNVRVFFIGNNTEECSDILSIFNFIPLQFGTYKLKNRHCVIDYIQNNKAYETRRKHAIANDLDDGTSNFTNVIKRDLTLITKERLFKPTTIIKFSKSENDWFTVWNNNVINKYNKEQVGSIAMRRYIDDYFNTTLRDNVFDMYDARAYKFTSLIIQTQFNYQLSMLKGK